MSGEREGGLLTTPLSVQVEEGEDPAPEEGDEKDERAKVKLHPSTVRRLIRRRHKVPEADAHHKAVSFKELLKLNRPDWPLVLIGVILSAVIGCLFPLMAVLFSEVLRVSRCSSPLHLTDLSPPHTDIWSC